jgi:hypothetical protein
VAYVTRRAETDTALEVIDADSERRLRRVILPGRLSVPAVAYDATPSGLSADGRTLVLIDPRRAFPPSDTAFTFVETRTLAIRRRLTLKGDFSFDALPRRTDDVPDPLPVAEGRHPLRGACLRPAPWPAAREADRGSARAGRAHERHADHPRDGARRPLGIHAVRGSGVAFIHALDTERREAFCIDLEAIANGPQGVLGAKLELDGGTLAVVTGQWRLASVDTRTLRAKIAGRPKSGETITNEQSARDQDSGVPWLLVLAPALLVAAGLALLKRRSSQAAIASSG